MSPALRKHWKSLSIFICISIWACASQAVPIDLLGQRYQAPDGWAYQGHYKLNTKHLNPIDKVAVTGGHYVQQTDFKIINSGRYVLDFSTSSIIGNFRHTLFNEQGDLVATMQGGIESQALNPFFLRHGREVYLLQGQYRLLTELKSAFFLATPQTYLNTIDAYRQSIKLGNTLTLMCLGIFFSMMLYYAMLAIIRKNLSNALYSLFILGNFLFNGMALLVLPDLFGLHWIYGVSTPILFSNCVYLLFVMNLLKIRQQTYPRLYLIGKSLLVLLASLIVLALLMPSWSLEIDRYGVGIFLFYGLSLGIVRSIDGSTTAKLYMFAIGIFFVLGIFTILLEELGSYTLYIEHMGLISVTVEIMMLALVLSYQFAQLNNAKEQAVKGLQRSQRDTEIATDENKELKKLHKDALLSIDKKSQFLANMSHEIRTPMNAIIGMTQLVQKTDLSFNQRNYLDKIYGAAYALLGIINDILDFSKFESGNLTLEHEEFKIKTVIQYLNDLAVPLLDGKQIVVDFKVDPNVPVVFFGDSLRLGQVLLNLLTNAIKFTKKGSVIVTVKRLNSDPNQAELYFSVVDTGLGLSEHQLEHLFGSFTQADHSTSRLYGGTGLGLAISKQLVEAMGGEIGVESDLGQGSTFFFTIALDIQHEVSSDQPSAVMENSNDHLGLRGIRVLLVEDNLINQEMMQELLESNGIYVDIANNGIEAITLINKQDYAAVLMDCQMPRMDGYEATRVIRSNSANKDLPIIALTANVMKADLDRCLSSGMNDYICKPLQWEQFFQKLEQWVMPTETTVRPLTKVTGKFDKEFIDLTNNLPGFDFENHMDTLPKNKTRLLSVLKMFYQQLCTDGEIIASQVGTEKLVAVKQLHKLGGSASILGAKELHLASIALEKEWQQGHFDNKTFESWNKVFNLTKDTLNKLFSESSAAEINNPATGIRQQLLQKLQGLLVNDSFINDEQLLYLKELLGDDEQVDYQQLHDAILNTDYDQALSVINTLMPEPVSHSTIAIDGLDSRAIILIVDDVRDNQEIMALMLNQEFCVKVAGSGKRALEIAQQQGSHLDLILLDMHMPEMDGYEVCRELQHNEVSHEIPVIFVTASTNDELEIKALQLGAVDYISKPINSNTLTQRIRNQLVAKQYKSELKHVAHYDPLTGIPNRLLLKDRLNQAIAYAKREQKKLAVCYLDLDGFKPVNDKYGHHVGDSVLIEIAKRIEHILRESDTVARIGGDEFIVLLADFNVEHECLSTLKRLHKTIEQPITIQEYTVSVSASIGVCIFPEGGSTPDVLLNKADQAMYVAKGMGKNCYQIADDSLGSTNTQN